MSEIAGYSGKIGFRLFGNSTTQVWPTTQAAGLTSTYIDTLGAFDRLTAIGENISESLVFNYDPLHVNYSGQTSDSVSLTGTPEYQINGDVQIQGFYNGLTQILAAAMGFERVRVSGALESPSYYAQESGTVTASSASTLSDSTAAFDSTMLGSFVRLENTGASKSTMHQVRLITQINSSTQITVSPDWTDIPGVGIEYTVGRDFLHTFEFSRDFHIQPHSEVVSNPWVTNSYLTRHGTLCSYKVGGSYEFCLCYVSKLNIKIGQDGLRITPTFLFRDYQRRVAGRNTISTTWAVHSQTYYCKSKVLFGDLAFRIADYNTAGLSSSDKVGISSFELDIDNGLEAEMLHNISQSHGEPLRARPRSIRGSFTLPRVTSISPGTLPSRFYSTTLQMADLVFTGPQMTSTTAKLSLFLKSVHLDKEDIALTNAGVIPSMYGFTCLQPVDSSITGMPTATTGLENGEVVIQLTDNNPFNYYMGQDNDAGV